MRKRTTLEFIRDSSHKHDNFYSYDKTSYSNQNNKVIITCPIHGDFEQVARQHLHGQGCHKCSIDKNRVTREEFITRSNVVHENFYDYSLVKFDKIIDKVKIICPIHGQYIQQANVHYNGSKCPKCANLIRNNTDKYKVFETHQAILYYVKINNFYKIGVTTKDINERFKNDIKRGVHITPIIEKVYAKGIDALRVEKNILTLTESHQIDFENSPIEGGWTEMRDTDIIDIVNYCIQNPEADCLDLYAELGL